MLLRVSKILNGLRQLVYAVGKRHLRGEQSLVLIPELLMIDDQQFQRPLDPVEASRAVFIRHAVIFARGPVLRYP